MQNISGITLITRLFISIMLVGLNMTILHSQNSSERYTWNGIDERATDAIIKESRPSVFKLDGFGKVTVGNDGLFTKSISLPSLITRNLSVPLLMTYRPGTKPTSIAGWVGMGWSLELGSIKRQTVDHQDELKAYPNWQYKTENWGDGVEGADIYVITLPDGRSDSFALLFEKNSSLNKYTIATSTPTLKERKDWKVIVNDNDNSIDVYDENGTYYHFGFKLMGFSGDVNGLDPSKEQGTYIETTFGRDLYDSDIIEWKLTDIRTNDIRGTVTPNNSVAGDWVKIEYGFNTIGDKGSVYADDRILMKQTFNSNGDPATVVRRMEASEYAYVKKITSPYEIIEFNLENEYYNPYLELFSQSRNIYKPQDSQDWVISRITKLKRLKSIYYFRKKNKVSITAPDFNDVNRSREITDINKDGVRFVIDFKYNDQEANSDFNFDEKRSFLTEIKLTDNNNVSKRYAFDYTSSVSKKNGSIIYFRNSLSLPTPQLGDVDYIGDPYLKYYYIAHKHPELASIGFNGFLNTDIADKMNLSELFEPDYKFMDWESNASDAGIWNLKRIIYPNNATHEFIYESNKFRNDFLFRGSQRSAITESSQREIFTAGGPRLSSQRLNDKTYNYNYATYFNLDFASFQDSFSTLRGLLNSSSYNEGVGRLMPDFVASMNIIIHYHGRTFTAPNLSEFETIHTQSKIGSGTRSVRYQRIVETFSALNFGINEIRNYYNCPPLLTDLTYSTSGNLSTAISQSFADINKKYDNQKYLVKTIDANTVKEDWAYKINASLESVSNIASNSLSSQFYIVSNNYNWLYNFVNDNEISFNQVYFDGLNREKETRITIDNIEKVKTTNFKITTTNQTNLINNVVNKNRFIISSEYKISDCIEYNYSTVLNSQKLSSINFNKYNTEFGVWQDYTTWSGTDNIQLIDLTYDYSNGLLKSIVQNNLSKKINWSDDFLTIDGIIQQYSDSWIFSDFNNSYSKWIMGSELMHDRVKLSGGQLQFIGNGPVQMSQTISGTSLPKYHSSFHFSNTSLSNNSVKVSYGNDPNAPFYPDETMGFAIVITSQNIFVYIEEEVFSTQASSINNIIQVDHDGTTLTVLLNNEILAKKVINYPVKTVGISSTNGKFFLDDFILSDYDSNYQTYEHDPLYLYKSKYLDSYGTSYSRVLNGFSEQTSEYVNDNFLSVLYSKPDFTTYYPEYASGYTSSTNTQSWKTTTSPIEIAESFGTEYKYGVGLVQYMEGSGFNYNETNLYELLNLKSTTGGKYQFKSQINTAQFRNFTESSSMFTQLGLSTTTLRDNYTFIISFEYLIDNPLNDEYIYLMADNYAQCYIHDGKSWKLISKDVSYLSGTYSFANRIQVDKPGWYPIKIVFTEKTSGSSLKILTSLLPNNIGSSTVINLNRVRVPVIRTSTSYKDKSGNVLFSSSNYKNKSLNNYFRFDLQNRQIVSTEILDLNENYAVSPFITYENNNIIDYYLSTKYNDSSFEYKTEKYAEFIDGGLIEQGVESIGTSYNLSDTYEDRGISKKEINYQVSMPFLPFGNLADLKAKYDPYNNSKYKSETLTDEEGKRTVHYYNNQGQKVLSWISQDSLDTIVEGDIITQYEYDISGNLTSIIKPKGNIVTYEYNQFKQIVKEKDSNLSYPIEHIYDSKKNKRFESLNTHTSSITSQLVLNTSFPLNNIMGLSCVTIETDLNNYSNYSLKVFNGSILINSIPFIADGLKEFKIIIGKGDYSFSVVGETSNNYNLLINCKPINYKYFKYDNKNRIIEEGYYFGMAKPSISQIDNSVFPTMNTIPLIQYSYNRTRADQSYFVNRVMEKTIYDEFNLNASPTKMQYIYDQNGNVVKNITSHSVSNSNVLTYEISKKFNEFNLLTETTSKYGNKFSTLKNIYNDWGELKEVKLTQESDFTNQNILEYDYDEYGRVSKEKFTLNNEEINYNYYFNGALKGINNPSSMNLDKFAYELIYYKNKNIKTNIFRHQTDSSPITFNYQYNKDNSLFKFNSFNNIISANFSAEYDYDLNGNVDYIKRSLNNNYTQYGYNHDNDKISQIVKTQFLNNNSQVLTHNYTYDEMGNMIKNEMKGIDNILIGRNNMPILIRKGSSYLINSYNENNIRIRKKSNVGSDEIFMIDENGTVFGVIKSDGTIQKWNIIVNNEIKGFVK